MVRGTVPPQARSVVLFLGRDADTSIFRICSQHRFWLHLHPIVDDLLDQVHQLLLEDQRGGLLVLDRIDSELMWMFRVLDTHQLT